MSSRVPLGSVAQSIADPDWPARFSRLLDPGLWMSAEAAAVSVVAAALLAVSVLVAVASASAAAASVVAALAAALVVAAAAVAAVPSPPGPRSALSRGPRSWRRDWLRGRAPECRS